MESEIFNNRMGFINRIYDSGLNFYRHASFRYKPNCMRSINDAGVALIKEFEGCALRSYQDSGGVWTVGFGHTSKVGPATTCTADLALQWLKEDLEISESLISHYVSVPLSDNQFSALVSLIFNIGLVDFRDSTLLKMVNLGAWEKAADEFARWDKVDGIPNSGILRRRIAERDLFIS